jgi:geranylgeranyl diphosphate synthase type II
MIAMKTARMIAAAAEVGALIGGGTRAEVHGARSYGHNLGMAFQLNDDLLDITGDPEDFGKAIGGDVKEGKKTYLLLRGLERTRGRDHAFLASVAPGKRATRQTIRRVQRIYDRTGVLADARREIGRFTRAAQRALASLAPSPSRDMLDRLAEQLLHRTA